MIQYVFLQQYAKIHAKMLNFRVDFVFCFTWGTDLFNAVLSWYQIYLPKSAYNAHLKESLYHMIKLMFFTVACKNSRKNIKVKA